MIAIWIPISNASRLAHCTCLTLRWHTTGRGRYKKNAFMKVAYDRDFRRWMRCWFWMSFCFFSWFYWFFSLDIFIFLLLTYLSTFFSYFCNSYHWIIHATKIRILLHGCQYSNSLRTLSRSISTYLLLWAFKTIRHVNINGSLISYDYLLSYICCLSSVHERTCCCIVSLWKTPSWEETNIARSLLLTL